MTMKTTRGCSHTALFAAMALILAGQVEVALAKLGSSHTNRKQGERDLALPAWEDLGSSPTVLLTLCQGDCDNDDDCAGDLICHQRDAGEDVPGCANGHEALSATDFCIEPVQVAASAGTEIYYPSAPPSAAPSSGLLPKCHGDCDTNDDCSGDLICYQRYHGEAVPGCNNKEFDFSKSDYCIDPVDYAADPEPIPQGVVVKIFDPIPDGHTLGLCEGHCNDNSECGFGLFCYDPDMSEDEDEPLVPLDTPHCIDEETYSIETRVCVPKRSYGTSAGYHGATSLKLFQDDANTFDWGTVGGYSASGWCMDCVGTCQEGSELVVKPCTEDSPRWDRTSVSVRIEGNSIFKLHFTSLCIQRDGNNLKLGDCDYSWIDPKQLWYSQDGSFDDDKFVISQRWYKYCVTQPVFPVAGGPNLTMESCDAAEAGNRVYWERTNSYW